MRSGQGGQGGRLFLEADGVSEEAEGSCGVEIVGQTLARVDSMNG